MFNKASSCLSLICVFAIAGMVSGLVCTATASAAAAAAAADVCQDKLAAVQITGLSCKTPYRAPQAPSAGANAPSAKPNEVKCSLNQDLFITADGLTQALTSCNQSPNNLALYLDGRYMDGISATPSDKDTYAFHLQRSDKSRAAWAALIGSPTVNDVYAGLSPTEAKSIVSVGIGISNQSQFAKSDGEKSARKFKLVLNPFIDPRFVLAALISLIIFLLLFIRMAYSSNMLRDQPPGLIDGRPPYSLGRVQMAVWFFLVVGAFLLIYVITGDYNAVITPQALVLIGIGTGTTLGAAMVDDGKYAKASDGNKALFDQWKAFNATYNARKDIYVANNSENNKIALEDSRKALEEINKKLNDLTNGTWSAKSKDFITDILNDGQGVSLHRFQMVLWTVVLAGIFIYQTWAILTLPDFDTNLLALMGISSGTYLGFKIGEKT